ncbi:OLC1v1022179C1 [Oldenlandia corymbosa var. corymbosa]|uniref:OLC1v1022179C1 n=1 Tax=Oldenlandia corymbosa var. corymbosa TaxID=529605 RepID=A0AAV1BXA4_OLDCO|nr:OLC1v1022179C1 [Oldenlandia corymbosa var. corymbosa]
MWHYIAVPIGVVASFRKMKKLTKDVSLIATALRESSLLVVSPNGKKVKRLHPLPPTEVKDPMLCTVVVENLPNDHSVENLQRIFGEAGKIQKIVIRDPHDARDSRKLTTTEKLLTTKLHALVEYDTVEAAERAVSSLNNEQDWRYGLRVKLLKKKTKTEGKAEGKTETRKKVWQEVDDDKNSTGQATNSVVEEENHCSSDHHDDSHDEEEGHLQKERTGENPQKDKTGEHQQKEHNGQRNRNRGRGRRQKYNGTNGHGHGHGTPPNSHHIGHGHGTPPNSHHIGHGHGTPPNSHHFEPSKPPPGPKMPDGTRGFTLGRGRPLQSNQS